MFGSEAIPDHAVPTPKQKNASRLRDLHAQTVKQISQKTAHKVNKTNHKRDDFISKFPDKNKRNPHPHPLAYTGLNHANDISGDHNYLFVTANEHHSFCDDINLEATSFVQSIDADSNYIHMDLSHYSARTGKEEPARGSIETFPQNSRSIRVQSDLGGSIHTNSASMQHLSFDRDTGRLPPSMLVGELGGMRGDASIALSSVNNDGGGDTDDMDVEFGLSLHEERSLVQ